MKKQIKALSYNVVMLIIITSTWGCKHIDLSKIDKLDSETLNETYLGSIQTYKVSGDQVTKFSETTPVSMTSTGNEGEVLISGLTGIGSIPFNSGTIWKCSEAGEPKKETAGTVSGLVGKALDNYTIEIHSFAYRDERAELHDLQVSGTIVFEEKKSVMKTVGPEHVVITGEVPDENCIPKRQDLSIIRFIGEISTPM
ncbi:MAG: hypothetical protein ABIA04_01710 [Pseudomonadota bacterium]